MVIIISYLILLSGKINLFILENTNFTNNTKPFGVFFAYRIRIARIPSGW